MHKLLNACLVLTVLLSGYFLYSHEHATRGAEQRIAKIESEIADKREQIKLLNAEWASLTRADRLEELAQQNLKLQPIAAQQFAEPADLKSRLPEKVTAVAVPARQDAIADIIKEMQGQ